MEGNKYENTWPQKAKSYFEWLTKRYNLTCTHKQGSIPGSTSHMSCQLAARGAAWRWLAQLTALSQLIFAAGCRMPWRTPQAKMAGLGNLTSQMLDKFFIPKKGFQEHADTDYLATEQNCMDMPR